MPDLSLFLTFDTQAEDAAKLYVATFEGAKILDTTRMNGKVFSLVVELFGQKINFMNGGPTFSFGNGTSLFVSCDTQEEIDRYWAKLADGGKEVQCGWLTDRFGVTWQIIPRQLGRMLQDADRAKAGRAMQAMMKMVKLDIAELERAHAGA
jgi:predicted 3-demethylubiquinone-9 3-methyltransferase (glyoxalase superfamily)